MRTNFLGRLFAVLILISLVVSGSVPLGALAQDQGSTSWQEHWAAKAALSREKIDKRVTQTEREAAAQRMADGGFELPKAGVAQMQPGAVPHYFSHPNYANSPYPVGVTQGACSVTTTTPCWYNTDCPQTPAAETCVGAVFSGGIRKFVDPLPWGPGGAPLNIATATDMPDGSKYYQIGLVQYRQIMHSDLAGPTTKGTLLRGYVQLTACGTPGAVPLSNEMLDGTTVSTGSCGVTAPSYLGPTILARKDVPVRILFRNLLPVGAGGDLFIPTDTSVMGAGMGPDLHGMPEVDPQNPTCGAIPKPQGCFTENRADLHLHGGLTPWISDGTPHQWITPRNEPMPYPDQELVAQGKKNNGVSMEMVPDMWYLSNGSFVQSCFGQVNCGVTGATNDPGQGAQTYYYTNQQSARLLFYHDHAWGITRLNVYAGEAAPYLIQDTVEDGLTGAGGALEGLGIGIPLVVQDKTFVPDPAQLAVSDDTWDSARWGGVANLWLPHVYSPAQNPGDASGVNAFGRWAYGPWFWPPTSNISYGPIDNPYFCDKNGFKQDGVTPCDPGVPPCDPDLNWCEPPLIPGTPYNSMGMEAFHDTMLVNGKAYPTVTLSPGEYRLRILNAASDRFINLNLYQADPAAPTEVQLNPAEVAAALVDPTIFPTPVAGTEGPAWVQIGTEGGFLPAPVVVPNQYITWVTDPTVFNAGNVDLHSLLLGPAERADVVIDLTPFAGRTLILYNDAPAAFPARDPRYDYYTGNGDYRDTGGGPPTLPGYGPNTRTVMQIVVTGNQTTPIPNHVNAARLAALEAAFAHNAGGTGVFESGQHPIIVGQGEYNSAYGTTFQTDGPMNGTAQIFDFSLTFNTLPQVPGDPLGTLTMGFGTKAIQDEQGEAFDRDYGRMSGNLGLEVPLVGGPLQNLILYPYVNPTSELIDATKLPPGNLDVTPIAVADDGSQIWKITHNGVDTHPIHFHLFDVQVLNRVGWDGIIRKPDLTELGWKDTVRISPLEDTIVALRPVIPWTPFDAAIPNSNRPLNPAMPKGSTLMFTNMDAQGNPTDPIVNNWTNFGWEYVWHCHILSHEEMDMMRPISVSAPPLASVLTGQRLADGRDRLNWTDPTKKETAYEVRRGPTVAGPWTLVATLAANTRTLTTRPPNNGTYFYQVTGVNQVGYSATVGYSTLTTSSTSNILQLPPGQLPPAPNPPSAMTAAAQTGPNVLLGWVDGSNNETGFAVERCAGAGCTNFAALVTTGQNVVTFTDLGVTAGTTYNYRVAAVNAGGYSAWAVSNEVIVPPTPLAPSSVLATAVAGQNAARVTLTWTDNSNNETRFEIQRATDPNFTANVVNAQVGANVRTYSTGTVPRSTAFYFRVRARNGSGPSVWVNASPFPITTP
jgi:FtsP/CotA-like multicopper oxidase with cupredoxin domain